MAISLAPLTRVGCIDLQVSFFFGLTFTAEDGLVYGFLFTAEDDNDYFGKAW